MISNTRSNRISIAFSVVGFFFIVGLVFAAMASASLSRVGSTLTDGNVKAQTGFMLRHDRSVQSFLGISVSKAYDLKVEKTKKIRCRIGYSSLCPFNTGKAGTRVTQTSYRHGQVRDAYRVTFTYSSVTKTVTFHKLSSNLLSGAKVVKHAKRRVVTAKKVSVNVVTYKVTTAAGCDASGSWSTAVVKPSYKRIKVAASSKGWKTLLKYQQPAPDTSASSSAHCGSGAGGGVKMSCAQMGLIESSPGSGVCQANSASSSQDANVQNDCKGPNTNSSQCVTTINQTTIINQTNINATCSIVQFGDGSTVYVENGSIVDICSNTNPTPPNPPEGGKDGDPGAGNGNSGTPGDDESGAGDSGTVPSADCWLLDGNNDPTIKGRWINGVCVRITTT